MSIKKSANKAPITPVPLSDKVVAYLKSGMVIKTFIETCHHCDSFLNERAFLYRDGKQLEEIDPATFGQLLDDGIIEVEQERKVNQVTYSVKLNTSEAEGEATYVH